MLELRDAAKNIVDAAYLLEEATDSIRYNNSFSSTAIFCHGVNQEYDNTLDKVWRLFKMLIHGARSNPIKQNIYWFI